MLLKRGSLFHLQLQMMADVRKSLSMRRLGRLKCWFKDNHLQLQMMADVKKNLVAAFCFLFFFLERKMSCVTVDRLKSRHSLRSFLSDTRWFHNSVQHLQKWHGWQYIQFRSPVKSQHRSTWYVANNAAPAVVIR